MCFGFPFCLSRGTTLNPQHHATLIFAILCNQAFASLIALVGYLRPGKTGTERGESITDAEMPDPEGWKAARWTLWIVTKAASVAQNATVIWIGGYYGILRASQR